MRCFAGSHASAFTDEIRTRSFGAFNLARQREPVVQRQARQRLWMRGAVRGIITHVSSKAIISSISRDLIAHDVLGFAKRS